MVLLGTAGVAVATKLIQVFAFVRRGRNCNSMSIRPYVPVNDKDRECFRVSVITYACLTLPFLAISRAG